jgi:hypothetical protein
MTLDMKEIERRAYLTLSEDGIIDIVIGCVFLGWGSLLAAGPASLIGLLVPLALGLWYVGKRFLTIPRVGLVIPSKKMESKFRNYAALLLVFGIILLVGIVIWQVSGGGSIGKHSLGLLGLAIAAGISSAAFLLDAKRLYAYAALLFIAFAVGESLNPGITTIDTFLVSVILASGLIVLSGLVVLIRFLRKYPLPAKEDRHGEG